MVVKRTIHLPVTTNIPGLILGLPEMEKLFITLVSGNIKKNMTCTEDANCIYVRLEVELQWTWFSNYISEIADTKFNRIENWQ